MNYLAHLYLSGSDTEVMIGNFIADHIRGNQFKHYSQGIQRGIRLHREIDTYTDAHPITRRSKRRLDKKYGLCAGVIIDLFHDHFLAKNWDEYSAIPLDVYVASVYALLGSNLENLPEKTQHLLPFMVEYNWLYNYQFIKGMQRVFNGMNRRTKNKSQIHLATYDLQEYYLTFERDFKEFFQQLIAFTDQKLQAISLISTI